VKGLKTDLKLMAAFIGAIVIIKLWYIVLPLVLFGMYIYYKYIK